MAIEIRRRWRRRKKKTGKESCSNSALEFGSA